MNIALPAWADPFLRPARFKSMSGGRGSGKSHTFAQIAVMRMANLLPYYKPGPVRIASARQFQTSIAESVKVAVEHYIKLHGMEDEFSIHKFAIDHRHTGSHMWFPGFNRHPESLMSTEAMDVLWIEQAETIGAEMEKIIPSVRAPGSELWFSWNPMARTQWCWERFKVKPRQGDVRAHVNYDDNPWWYPHCPNCNITIEWESRDDPCWNCEGEVWPGLWELEIERAAMEVEEPDRYPHVWLGEPDDGDADKQVLTYGVLKQCVEAWDAGLAPDEDEAPLTDVGLDMAEGGVDKCAQVIRRGPVVEFIDLWPGVAGDLSVAARRAQANIETQGVDIDRLYYDASSPMRREFLAIDAVDYPTWPVNFGGEVGGKDTLYESRRKNGQVFRARNIQMADNLRLRANRTVRLLKDHKAGRVSEIDPVDCLFIRSDLPDLRGLLADLTQPIRRQNPTTGKWELDKRGGDEAAKSPDRFDGLCLAYARDSEWGLKVR